MRTNYFIYFVVTLSISILIALYYIPVWWVKSRLSTVEFEVQQKNVFAITNFDQLIIDNYSSLTTKSLPPHFRVFGYKKIRLKNLWVDQCEVTRTDFFKFSEWAARKTQLKTFKKQPQSWHYQSKIAATHLINNPNYSISGVSYYDAYAYCQNIGGRLPLADEWQAIAMDKKQQLYAYGDQYKPDVFKHKNPLFNAYQVCSIQKNQAVAQLTSGLAEWANLAQGQPIIVGGGVMSKPHLLTSLNFVYQVKNYETRSDLIGFRCVYDKQPSLLTPWKTAIKNTLIQADTHSVGLPNKVSLSHFLYKPLPVKKADLKRYFNQTSYSLTKITQEIPVRAYQVFLSDPFVKLGLYANKQEPKNHEYQPKNWSQQKNNPNQPVVMIDWWSAFAFSRWVGGRLPTAEEWKVLANHSKQKPSNNDQPSSSLSDFRLLDSVAEWTATLQLNPAGNRIIVKGVPPLLKMNKDPVEYQLELTPNQKADFIGFRVVF